MSKVLVLGPTGLGKSSSTRNLPPLSTGYINADMKAPPLHGWKANYKTVLNSSGKIDLDESNYVELNQAKHILTVFNAWDKSTKIKNIVFDTITHMITKEYMTNTIGKDFKAYQALGKTFYDLIELIVSSKKNVIVYAHAEKKINESGDIMWEFKSHGKMITDLVPASYFTTVLMAEKIKNATDPKKFDYVFRTQSEGNDPCKSPAWMDAKGESKTALDFYEPNDISTILEKLELFETGV